jgi:hypothetical protein
VLVDATCLLRCTPVHLSGATSGTFIHGSSDAPASPSSSATPIITLDAVVQGVGTVVPHQLLQLNDADSPTPVTDWVADSSTTNHTPPHSDHIYSLMPPSFAHPSSIVVSNGSVLPLTSVGDSVLSRPFYLNDVLVTPDLVQSLLFVYRFATDNSCSMEFDAFGLLVKDFATRRVLARYNSTDLLYTLPLPDSTAPTPGVVLYTLAAATSFAIWHRCLGHPGLDVLSKLSNNSAITCPRGRYDLLCHACQLGRHVRLPFPSSSSRII